MRIIAGKYKSLTIDVPNGDHVRPTSDRIRENIFNILDNKYGFDDENVIDLFSGSGALGFEAISRNAKHCLFIDRDVRSINTIKKNAEKLKVDSGTVSIIKSEVLNFNFESLTHPVKFIFADPPYNWHYFKELFIKLNSIKNFEDAVLMYESDKTYETGFKEHLFDERIYGLTKISLFNIG